MASIRDEPLTFTNPLSSSPIDGDSFLLDNSQIGSASGSFQNEGFLGAADGGSSGSDAEFGFSRPEFRQSPLVGTVDYYQRHVFLCYKTPKVWPPRIEAAEFDRLPRLLSAALAARKCDMKRQVFLFFLFFSFYKFDLGLVSYQVTRTGFVMLLQNWLGFRIFLFGKNDFRYYPQLMSPAYKMDDVIQI